MKIYGHLRDHHSAAMAVKVTFLKAAAEKQACSTTSSQP